MTQQHPISPPPELVKQWREQAPRCRDGGIAREDWLMTRAAQWGADQELEACCEWLVSEPWFKYEHEAVEDLRAARRPKPPSLKEQALEALAHILNNSSTQLGADTIRRALEQLPDNE
jgi:hypothetical protein